MLLSNEDLATATRAYGNLLHAINQIDWESVKETYDSIPRLPDCDYNDWPDKILVKIIELKKWIEINRP